MTENKKRFWLNSDDGLLNGIYNIFDEHNVLDGNEIVELLNALYEENEQLKKAEILANYRGEMIGFATALIDDLGSETMRKMWDMLNPFNAMKLFTHFYKENTKLKEENEQLKSELSEKDIRLDFLKADKMEYHEFAIIENVLIKIQMIADEKMNEDEK